MDKQMQRKLEMMQRIVRKYRQLDGHEQIRTLTYMQIRAKKKKQQLSEQKQSR